MTYEACACLPLNLILQIVERSYSPDPVTTKLRTLLCASRNLVFDRDDTDPAMLEVMVDYIRRQVLHMDRLDSVALLDAGDISFLPLSRSLTKIKSHQKQT